MGKTLQLFTHVALSIGSRIIATTQRTQARYDEIMQNLKGFFMKTTTIMEFLILARFTPQFYTMRNLNAMGDVKCYKMNEKIIGNSRVLRAKTQIVQLFFSKILFFFFFYVHLSLIHSKFCHCTKIYNSIL